MTSPSGQQWHFPRAGLEPVANQTVNETCIKDNKYKAL